MDWVLILGAVGGLLTGLAGLWASRNAARKSEVEALTATVEALARENERLRARLDELARENEQLRARLDELERENDNLRARLAKQERRKFR